MTAILETTPTERIAQFERARQLALGEVHIPLRCPQCGTRNLNTDVECYNDVRCLNGHTTNERRLHILRRQRIVRFIKTGTRT